MALTNFELFQKGRPISMLFPIHASNGIVIEQQKNFVCPNCQSEIPQISVRGFIIDKDDTLITHLFCQCAHCDNISAFSDAYEERLLGVSLWKKDGSKWEHTQDIDIPKRYWHKALWCRFSKWLKSSRNSDGRHNDSTL